MIEKMQTTSGPVRERHHAEIGKRFRQSAAKINWENISRPFLALQDAYEGLQHPAKLASQEEVLSDAHLMEALGREASTQAGDILKAACDLFRQLNLDADRERFRKQLETQRSVDGLANEDIRRIVGQPMAAAELGARVVATMDTLLKRLKEPVQPRHRPIHALAVRFKHAVLSELARWEIAGICKECGETFAFTSRRKRYCSSDCEGRDCAARGRSRRSYAKRAKPRMSRSESATKAARARWKRCD